MVSQKTRLARLPHATARWQLGVALAACLAAWLSTAAMAGGGPENVLLVVNPNSRDSLTIANHWARLRQVPPVNVFCLPWDPKVATTDVDTFRKQILIPVLEAMEKRKLAGQIDYIVYSSDFPWGIDLKPDVDRYLAAAPAGEKRALPKFLSPMGSLNGLTYLFQPLLAGDLGYMHLQNNGYMRGVPPRQREPPTLAFSSRQGFGSRGELLESDGRHYALSMMLGVTSGCGNSVAEVIHYLGRSAAADGTHPKGTIYFPKYDGVRSKARDATFPAAVEQLEKLGVAAAILSGPLPRGKSDVQGAMLGVERFGWRSLGSTILPGAICEHLTSFGGMMHADNRQTPLSELLRYGAAGASGTVTEPYLLGGLPYQPKFPTPMIHVHYARGCTLAEAFYQSVEGPYQLLIVGDPLCRPWANVPQVTVQGVEPGATVKGRLKLTPTATVPGGSKVDQFQLYIDGWQKAQCQPGGTLEIDTATLADGYHELRVVAVEAGWIRSQGRRIVPITTANHGRAIAVSMAPQDNVPANQLVAIAANSPGSAMIVVLHHTRPIATIRGEKGKTTINPATLGLGPIQLQVVGVGQKGPLDYATAKPLEFTVSGI